MSYTYPKQSSFPLKKKKDTYMFIYVCVYIYTYIKHTSTDTLQFLRFKTGTEWNQKLENNEPDIKIFNCDIQKKAS